MSDFKEIYYKNPITKQRSKLKIEISLIENSTKFPVAVTTKYEDILLTLYIDGKYSVRGVEKSYFVEGEEEKSSKSKSTSEFVPEPLLDEKDYVNNEEKMNFGKVLILGLSKAGKTSMINRLTLNYLKDTKPTLGASIIRAILGNTRFVFYDMGGQTLLRAKWYSTIKSPDAIVFIIDVTSTPEVQLEAKSELDKIIKFFYLERNISNPELKQIPLLILGNKIDVLGKKGQTKEEIMENFMNLIEMDRYSVNYRAGLVSARTGDGVDYNFKWLIVKDILMQ